MQALDDRALAELGRMHTAREALEETGLVVEVGPLVEVFDRILLDDAGICATAASSCASGAQNSTFKPPRWFEHRLLRSRRLSLLIVGARPLHP